MDAKDRLRVVEGRIAAAAERAGRDPATVQLVAVSKTHPADSVRELSAAGAALFGESRVQEAAEKIPGAPPGLHWHFIGRLQRNKARKAVQLFELIHSVDSLRLADTLARLGEEREKAVDVLIEVKIGEEKSKGGIRPVDLEAFLRQLRGRSGLRIRGLMTIPPPAASAEDQRPAFRRLATLAQEIRTLDLEGVCIKELSMGMSSDYEIAVEEGATLVRVGTALFGPRRPWPR